jgi:hypothetical protein
MLFCQKRGFPPEFPPNVITPAIFVITNANCGSLSQDRVEGGYG